jgi:hypothetical protein
MQVTVKGKGRGWVRTSENNEIDFDQDGIIVVNMNDNTIYFASNEDLMVSDGKVIKFEAAGFTFEIPKRMFTYGLRSDADWLVRRFNFRNAQKWIKESGLKCISPNGQKGMRADHYLAIAHAVRCW